MNSDLHKHSSKNTLQFVRISGVNVPAYKHSRIALQSIFGVGLSVAMDICRVCEVDPYKPLLAASDEAIERIRDNLKHRSIEITLRKKMASDIDRLIRIKSYRGKRLRYGLPCNGQNTHSNANTARRRNGSLKTLILNG